MRGLARLLAAVLAACLAIQVACLPVQNAAVTPDYPGKILNTMQSFRKRLDDTVNDGLPFEADHPNWIARADEDPKIPTWQDVSTHYAHQLGDAGMSQLKPYFELINKGEAKMRNKGVGAEKLQRANTLLVLSYLKHRDAERAFRDADQYLHAAHWFRGARFALAARLIPLLMNQPNKDLPLDLDLLLRAAFEATALDPRMPNQPTDTKLFVQLRGMRKALLQLIPAGKEPIVELPSGSSQLFPKRFQTSYEKLLNQARRDELTSLPPDWINALKNIPPPSSNFVGQAAKYYQELVQYFKELKLGEADASVRAPPDTTTIAPEHNPAVDPRSSNRVVPRDGETASSDSEDEAEPMPHPFGSPPRRSPRAYDSPLFGSPRPNPLGSPPPPPSPVAYEAVHHASPRPVQPDSPPHRSASAYGAVLRGTEAWDGRSFQTTAAARPPPRPASPHHTGESDPARPRDPNRIRPVRVVRDPTPSGTVPMSVELEDGYEASSSTVPRNQRRRKVHRPAKPRGTRRTMGEEEEEVSSAAPAAAEVHGSMYPTAWEAHAFGGGWGAAPAWPPHPHYPPHPQMGHYPPPQYAAYPPPGYGYQYAPPPPGGSNWQYGPDDAAAAYRPRPPLSGSGSRTHRP